MSLDLGVTSTTINGITNGLFLTNQEINQLTVTIKSGEDLTRGTLVGKITSGGKYVKWDNRTSGAATDGSQTLVGVLLEDVDATAGDELGTIAINGVLNKDLLVATTTVIVGNYNNLGTILIKGTV